MLIYALLMRLAMLPMDVTATVESMVVEALRACRPTSGKKLFRMRLRKRKPP